MGDTTGSQLHIYLYQVLRPAESTKYWRLLPPEHVQTSYTHVPGTSPKHTKDVNNSHRAARSISATTVALLAHIPRQAPNSRAASPYLGIRIQFTLAHACTCKTLSPSGCRPPRELRPKDRAGDQPRKTHQAISARPCRPSDHVKGTLFPPAHRAERVAHHAPALPAIIVALLAHIPRQAPNSRAAGAISRNTLILAHPPTMASTRNVDHVTRRESAA